MNPQVLILTPSQIGIALEWLVDCFPDAESEINGLTHWEVQRAIEKYWDGGLADFIRANNGAEMAHADTGLFGDY
jgi:hypothetical protein